jgi:hypothetical protein
MGAEFMISRPCPGCTRSHSSAVLLPITPLAPGPYPSLPPVDLWMTVPLNAGSTGCETNRPQQYSIRDVAVPVPRLVSRFRLPPETWHHLVACVAPRGWAARFFGPTY